MFTYTLKGHDGLEWRTLSKPISQAEAVRQFKALICAGVPAQIHARTTDKGQEHTMAFMHSVIEAGNQATSEEDEDAVPA